MIRSLIRFLVGAFILVTASPVCAQKATISEQYIDFKTYMFSDPDPVPTPGRIYPYFYFNGYTNSPVLKKWKMVVLENDFIKVFVCPDIGGKVWGAIEKSTGKEFLYFNNVVKFRDVAMRGAWTSGGLEYNFGDIGHIPTCATPVDYINKEYPDGSVRAGSEAFFYCCDIEVGNWFFEGSYLIDNVNCEQVGSEIQSWGSLKVLFR